MTKFGKICEQMNNLEDVSPLRHLCCDIGFLELSNWSLVAMNYLEAKGGLVF